MAGLLNDLYLDAPGLKRGGKKRVKLLCLIQSLLGRGLGNSELMGHVFPLIDDNPFN